MSRQRRPSTTWSLRSTWLTSTRPNVGVDRSVERRVDGESVVVAGDGDPAGGAVLHRLVHAAMAELQLVGAEAERAAQHLVAEADPEHRLHAEHAAHRGDRSVGGRRVPGPLEKNTPSGSTARRSAGGRGRGQHVDLAAALGEVTRCRRP